MIKIENDCVGCGLPCLGNVCPYRNVPHFYCDDCGCETDLYHYEGEQLCMGCIQEKLKKVTSDDYDG